MGAGYQDQGLVFARSDGSPWPPAQFSCDFPQVTRSRGFASASTICGTPTPLSSSKLGFRSRWSPSASGTPRVDTLDVYSPRAAGDAGRGRGQDRRCSWGGGRGVAPFFSPRLQWSRTAPERTTTRKESAMAKAYKLSESEIPVAGPAASMRTSSATSSRRPPRPCR